MLKRRHYMPKAYRVYLDDILESIEKIEKYTKDISYKEFIQNTLLIDGVTRNLGIIGEAVKNLPLELRKKYPIVEWKKIAGLRDIIIYEEDIAVIKYSNSLFLIQI